LSLFVSFFPIHKFHLSGVNQTLIGSSIGAIFPIKKKNYGQNNAVCGATVFKTVFPYTSCENIWFNSYGIMNIHHPNQGGER